MSSRLNSLAAGAGRCAARIESALATGPRWRPISRQPADD